MNIISLFMVCCTFFFVLGISEFRRKINTNNALLFKDNQIVTITKVLDGDDLVITDKNGMSSRIRLIGIKSFKSSTSDPLTAEFGKIAFIYLKESCTGKQAKLDLSGTTIDSNKRILGKLWLKDSTGKFSKDVGLDLLKQGYTLVYTKYNFRDLDNYLTAMQKAQKNNEGLWSNPRIRARSKALIKKWTNLRLEGKK